MTKIGSRGFVTACRSCGKVMFSQAYVKNSVRGGVCMPCTPCHTCPLWILWDAVNEQVVRILLECILVTAYKRSLEQGNKFTGISLSTGRSTWPGTPPGIRHPLLDQTHPLGSDPPGPDTPSDQTPPWDQTPPRPDAPWGLSTPPRTKYTPWD